MINRIKSYRVIHTLYIIQIQPYLEPQCVPLLVKEEEVPKEAVFVLFKINLWIVWFEDILIESGFDEEGKFVYLPISSSKEDDMQFLLEIAKEFCSSKTPRIIPEYLH